MKRIQLCTAASAAVVAAFVVFSGWNAATVTEADAASDNGGRNTPAVRSTPSKSFNASRKAIPEDFSPLGSPSLPATAKMFAPVPMGAEEPAILVVDPVVSAGLLGDTASDSETSIAVNPDDPNEIVISAFSGGWGANAPVFHSLDGGVTWARRLTIGAPNNAGGLGASGGPNDWAFDYGRSDELSGGILTCRPGPVCNVVAGTTTDPANAASWAYTVDGSGDTQLVNNATATSIDCSDQPWTLVNRDTANAGSDNVYVAYDDFCAPGGVGMHVAASYNANPPDFVGPDVQVGLSTGGGVNPGLRMAKDPRTGYMYALWQSCTANCGNNNAKTINFNLNRSTDGGATWSLNASSTGIVVASGDSLQPWPKFGTANALLGGVDHAAVDPNTGDVYYVYGDIDTVQRIALRRVVSDGAGGVNVSGASWVSPDVHAAALPSVAVTSDGTVGVFYMTHEGFSADNFPIYAAWLAMSRDQGATFTSHLLQRFLSPVKDDGNATSKQRILGDYEQMKAQGDCFYGAFPGNGAPFGTTNSQIDAIFFKTCTGSQLQVDTALSIDATCVGASSTGTLHACNTGIDPLIVQSIASSDPQFAVVPTSGSFPVNIGPDSCFPFHVVFTPTSAGNKTATLTVVSNDPAGPTTVSVSATAAVPAMFATMAAGGVFGPVYLGDNKVLNLEVTNQSSVCPLVVTSLARTTGSTDFEFSAAAVALPVTLPVGQNVDLPIRYTPSSFTPPTATATFRLVTDDADSSPLDLGVSGESPAPNISLSGDLAFGNVCAEDTQAGTAQSQRTIQVCNSGTQAANTLTVDASLVNAGGGACDDFALLGDASFALSHDACRDVTVKYTPTEVGSHACTLVLASNDPDQPTLNVAAGGTTPAPAIDVNPDLGFLPEVVQSTGTCSSRQPFPIQNDGTCNLNVTAVTASGDFSLDGMPSTPVTLDNGELVGDGGLGVLFKPTVIARERSGVLSVTYESDPITHATTQVQRQLCGEGVNTGARVLVMANGIPMALVEQIRLQRITANRNKKIVDTIDTSKNLSLRTYTATAPCPSFQYHKEYGTKENPVQLLPGSYTVTVSALVGGKRKTRTVAFDVQTCDFNPTVIVGM